MNNNSPTLSEFILQTDAQIRLFDMGRRINKIGLSEFQKFESGDIPYPYPYQQTAWLGLLFWNKNNKEQHNIWFIRVPLDETGCIQLSARDEFMHMLLSRVKEQLENGQKSDEMSHILKDNPYVYKPTEEKMAVFHAKASQILHQEPSQFYTDVSKFLTNDDFIQWQQLGFQGIADYCARIDNSDISKQLRQKMEKIPTAVFNAFCQCLENENYDIELAKTITKRIDHSDDPNEITNAVRALAGCQSSQFKCQFIHSLLEKLTPEQTMILIAISAKNWECLTDESLLKLFLERLANCQEGAEVFNSVIVDLMFIPGMRVKILSEFRNPDRSDTMSTAVGNFFQSIQ